MTPVYDVTDPNTQAAIRDIAICLHSESRQLATYFCERAASHFAAELNRVSQAQIEFSALFLTWVFVALTAILAALIIGHTWLFVRARMTVRKAKRDWPSARVI